MASGDVLFLENIGESVDPVLDPLLGRLTIRKGRYIKIGDKEMELNPRFRLILQVRMYHVVVVVDGIVCVCVCVCVWVCVRACVLSHGYDR